MEQEAEQDDPAWEEEEAEPSLTHKTEPSSRQWKQRRMLARLFGISIGCVVPLLLSFLALGRHDVFRGPVASAKVLIEGDALGSADIEVLRETMRSECWVAQGGAVPTQHDCSLAESLAGHPASGEESLCSCAANVSSPLGSTLMDEGPISLVGSMEDILANNAAAAVISTLMFWILFWLWFNILKSDRLDKALEKQVLALAAIKDKAIVRTVTAVTMAVDAVEDAVDSDDDDESQPSGPTPEEMMKKKAALRKKTGCADVAVDLIFFALSGAVAMLAVWIIIDTTKGEPSPDGRSVDTFSTRFVAFCVGFLLGGGLLGAPFGEKLHKMVSPRPLPSPSAAGPSTQLRSGAGLPREPSWRWHGRGGYFHAARGWHRGWHVRGDADEPGRVAGRHPGGQSDVAYPSSRAPHVFAVD